MRLFTDAKLDTWKGYGAITYNIAVGIAIRYRLDGPRIEFRWGRIFRTRTDWPWDPFSRLYNRYRVSSLGVKRPGRDYPHPSSTEVEGKSSAIHLLPLWVFVACYTVNLLSKYCMHLTAWLLIKIKSENSPTYSYREIILSVQRCLPLPAGPLILKG
jgi:hypothetical protein